MILLDAHVHLHDCHYLEDILNSAQKNFLFQAKRLNLNSFQAFLCLTESHAVNNFEKLINFCDNNQKIGSWSLRFTGNNNVILCQKKDDEVIYIVSGRQIVTEEYMEVLGIGLFEDIDDGQSIQYVINYIHKNKAIPIIPWGVGKWIGNRKKILRKIINQSYASPIYLGDNGNRPWFWPKPSIFKLAQRKGILNLPGSDPLPFYRESQKPGSYGFFIESDVHKDKPFDSLYGIITNGKLQYNTFGNLESFTYFFKNQIAMQFIKRR